MRKFTVGLLIFIAGWSLSWVTYNYSGSDPLQSAQTVIPAQSATGFTSTTSSHVKELVRMLQRNKF